MGLVTEIVLVLQESYRMFITHSIRLYRRKLLIRVDCRREIGCGMSGNGVAGAFLIERCAHYLCMCWLACKKMVQNPPLMVAVVYSADSF